MSTDSKWPSFNNIHRAIYEQNKENEYNVNNPNLENKNMMCLDDFFNYTVNFTIKVDGSNLGIHIKKNSYNEWFIEKLKGRNSTIWTVRNTKSINKLPKYGNVVLGNLPNVMFEYAKLIGEIMKVNEIIIYGEAVRIGEFASWHPFGMSGVSDDFILLTSEIHKLFSSCQLLDVSVKKAPTISDNKSMIEYLKTIKSHVVFPPPILFHGKLSDGINMLYDTMNTALIDFEGLFIVNQTLHTGYKWKTGFHDEQVKISNVSELNFETDEAKQTYIKLFKIFETRPQKEERISLARSTESKNNLETLRLNKELLKTMTNTALQRELTKMTSFEHVPKNERRAIADTLTKLVIEEIKRQYLGRETEIPWTDESMDHDVKSHITTYIMKINYVKSI
jgi:hypothetical protein